MLLASPINGYSQEATPPTVTVEGAQVPLDSDPAPIVVGAIAEIVKGAVGDPPSEVGTLYDPAGAPVVGTDAHTNLASVVPLPEIVQAEEGVDPGTVAVIPPLGNPYVLLALPVNGYSQVVGVLVDTGEQVPPLVRLAEVIVVSVSH